MWTSLELCLVYVSSANACYLGWRVTAIRWINKHNIKTDMILITFVNFLLCNCNQILFTYSLMSPNKITFYTFNCLLGFLVFFKSGPTQVNFIITTIIEIVFFEWTYKFLSCDTVNSSKLQYSELCLWYYYYYRGISFLCISALVVHFIMSITLYRMVPLSCSQLHHTFSFV